MTFLCGIGRNRPRHLGESKVKVTRGVSRLHLDVAGEGGGNAELLLGPVEIGDTITLNWPNERTHPGGWTENAVGITGGIATGPSAKRGQHTAITTIGADSQFVKAQLRKSMAQF